MQIKYIFLFFLTFIFSINSISFADNSQQKSIDVNAQNKRVKRVVGGEDVVYAKYSFFAKIDFINPTDDDKSSSCGGALINQRWVITARHCVENYDENDKASLIDPKNINITFLQYDKNNNENIITRKVSSFYIDTKYNSPTGNDIALLKLDSPVETNIVKPIDLYTQELPSVNNYLTLIGFGVSVKDKMLILDTRLLQEAQINITDNKNCVLKGEDSEGSINTRTEFCAGNPSAKKIVLAGAGDSGGPIFLQQNNNYYLVGLVSRGTKDFDPENGKHDFVTGAYDIYTKISSFNKWINCIINSPNPNKLCQ